MKREDIIILIVVALIIYYLIFSKEVEGFETDSEALKNIASLYNSEQMTLSNLNVTRNINVDGDSKFSKNLNVNGKTVIDGDLVKGDITCEKSVGAKDVNATNVNAKTRMFLGSGKNRRLFGADDNNLFIASRNSLNDDWDWSTQLHLNKNGNLDIKGDIT